jgi:hypothetical protein
MARIVIRKEEYVAAIGRTILECLSSFPEAVDDEQFDRCPDPPLQSFAAIVTDQGGGVLRVASLGRLHGGHGGTGEHRYLDQAEAHTRLPAVLLEALGERPEDIPGLLDRLTRRASGRPTRGCS